MVRLAVPPLPHQRLELGVAAFGQHDAHGGEQVAGAILGGKALALEPEGAARIGAGRDRQIDSAVERGHAYLAAEHRLIERDRKLEPQVRALAGELRMRRDSDRDQHVAGAAAGPGEPLPFEPDSLALGEPGRDLDLDLLAGGELHALRHALGGLRQGDGERGRDVVAAADVLPVEIETAAHAPAAGGAAERLLEQLLEAAAEAAKAAAGAAAGVLEALRTPGEGLEAALAAEAAAPSAAAAEAFEALEARLAFGVDLAGVEGLALVLLA